MAQLPPAFTEQTRQTLGEERFERFLQSLDEEPPVSIRLNPMKAGSMTVVEGDAVPWCRGAFYLPFRPNFTMDPLLHAGCYYVQEAASMFLDEVLRTVLSPLEEQGKALDLCAAPGGKSTLLRAALPPLWTVWSNEPIAQRAAILQENVEKWGYDGHIVTSSMPRDYRESGLLFDVILCDVPCSGEGMFRKDPATIQQWTPQGVERCAALQRDIVSDAWACLRPGGLMVYSTCTLNTRENEENIRWMMDTLEARPLRVDIREEWNITGSLLEGFDAPVYRFIPGITRSEGLFVCALEKPADQPLPRPPRRPPTLKTLAPQKPAATGAARVDIGYQQAVAYLRREALTLPPDTPRGIVELTFMGQPLGPAKNLGTRANNLYPKAWRIKTTHTTDDYTPVLTSIT